MKKLSIYAGLMALSVTSAAALYAAPGKADQDGDRIVTKAEAMAAGDARFAKMDADNNGTISQAEFMAIHEAGAERREDRREKRMERRGADMREGRQGGRRGGGAMAMMARADTNGDKAVSQAEFRAAIEARFAKADTNQDGNITTEERQAGRKGKWGGRMAPAQPNGG